MRSNGLGQDAIKHALSRCLPYIAKTISHCAEVAEGSSSVEHTPELECSRTI